MSLITTNQISYKMCPIQNVTITLIHHMCMAAKTLHTIASNLTSKVFFSHHIIVSVHVIDFSTFSVIVKAVLQNNAFSSGHFSVSLFIKSRCPGLRTNVSV